jgi:hypothetical protein
MARYIDAEALYERMLTYYDCVSEDTCKSNYNGESLMAYEVADMVEDCIENAPTVDVAPRADTINEFADRLIRYYDSLNGGTASGLVAYHVNKIRQEMLNKEENT